MSSRNLFIIGLILGIAVTAATGKKVQKWLEKSEIQISLPAPIESFFSIKIHKTITKFDSPMELASGKPFGKEGWLTPELFRNGQIIVDGKSGFAHQISPRYLDSAWIRSTKPLPPRYKISVVVGEVQYGLEKIASLEQDPQYSEGPLNENGVYFLTITDTEPRGHHVNTWWHQHRKVVVDVDNNVWGHGMPFPVFMVYFDRNNELNSWNGKKWTKDWVKAITYNPMAWYRVEIEKTWSYFIMSVYAESDQLLSRTTVPLSRTLSNDSWHKEYLVTGEPHENYYAGSYKIREIQVEY